MGREINIHLYDVRGGKTNQQTNTCLGNRVSPALADKLRIEVTFEGHQIDH